MYPLSFSEAAHITFTASVPSGGSADVYFRFEKNPFPDTEPSYNTAPVTISGSESMTYTVDVPAQGVNTFSSFLMYVQTPDVAVMVSDVRIMDRPAPGEAGRWVLLRLRCLPYHFQSTFLNAGSGPITSYTAACEIPDALELPVATKASSLTIGEVVELDLGALKTSGGRGVYGFAVDAGLFDAKAGDSLIFPASGGETVTLDVETRMVTKFDNVHFAGENGDLRFSLMMSPKGRLIGEYFDGSTSIEIRPDLSGKGHRLYVASEGAVLPVRDAEHIAKQAATYQEKPTDSLPALGEINDAFSVVSLLILVDDDVYNSGDAVLLSDFFVTAANTAFIDSGVRIVLSLVGVDRYQPDASTNDQQGILNEITCGSADCDINEPTYNEAVNNLREAYKADLVTQMVGFAQESSQGSCLRDSLGAPIPRISFPNGLEVPVELFASVCLYGLTKRNLSS